jgi:hypothetical protein
VPYSVTGGVGPVATTSALGVTPASPASSGATETLTATVTPADAAGTVDFFDGSTQLGTTQTVSGGTASVSIVLGDGDHSLTAVFTPTDATAFAASTSPAVSYTVGGTTTHPKKTRLHLVVGPSDHTFLNHRVWFRATVTPTWVHGTVLFYSGGRLLGEAKLKDGVATFSTDDLRVGSHGLWAKYVPFNPDNYMKSASNSVRYRILPAPCRSGHHGWNVSRLGAVVPAAAYAPVSIDAVPVAATSPVPQVDEGSAGQRNMQTGLLLVLGLLVAGAASVLTARRGPTVRRGPTAD